MQQHNYVGYFIIILSWAHIWPTQWPASSWLITCKSICRALHWYCRGQVFESHTSLNCFRLFFTIAKVASRNFFNSFHPAFPIIIICFSYIHYLTITSLHYCERKNLLCIIKLSTLVQAQIHISFHSFTQISQIFHNKYIFNDKK